MTKVDVMSSNLKSNFQNGAWLPWKLCKYGKKSRMLSESFSDTLKGISSHIAHNFEAVELGNTGI